MTMRHGPCKAGGRDFRRRVRVLQPVGRFPAAIRSARCLSLRRTSDRGWRFVYATGRFARVRCRLDCFGRKWSSFVALRRCATNTRSPRIPFFARRGIPADSQYSARFHLRVVCPKSLEVVRTPLNLPLAVRGRASTIPLIPGVRGVRMASC
jgi:hypothetical protein